jgi:hypothetical protein
MAQPDAVVATGSELRPLPGGEDHECALRRVEHVGAALGARPLFEEHELAAGEVGSRSREHGQDLEREEHLSVEVLVQGVPVAGAVAEDQRRRSLLAGCPAAGDELLVLQRVGVCRTAQSL